MELVLHRPWWRPLPVVVVCLSTALSGAILLYQDFNSSGLAGLGSPVAVIQGMEHTVRRKPAHSFLWGKLRTGADLYRRDAVQVGPESSASIKLSDGSVLEVGENSLVVIEDNKEVPLHFKQGSFVLRKDSGDTLVKVDKAGKSQTEQLPLRLLQPTSQSLSYVKTGAPKRLVFRWEPIKGAQGGHWDFLEISSSKTFSKRTTTQHPLDAEKTSFSTELPTGDYFWRIVSADNRVLTEVRSFHIQNAKALNALTPTPADKLVSWQKETRIPFTWEVPTGGKNIEKYKTTLEVASGEDFEHIAFQTPISATAGSAWIPAIPPGQYVWRLRTEYPELSVMSNVQAFKLVAQQRLPLTLLAPRESATVEKGTVVDLRWKLEGIQARYVLEILPDGGNGKKNVTESVSSSGRWTAESAGAYRWRVQAYKEKELIAESDWGHFSVLEGRPILLSAPRPNEKLQYWKGQADFQFRWEAASVEGQAPVYFVDISEDPKFGKGTQSIQTKEPVLRSQDASLKQGTFYWRVRLVNESGSLLRISPPSRFEHSVYPTLISPSEAGPSADAFFKKEKPDSDPVFEWASVPEAKAYELTIKRGKKVWRELATEKNTVRVKGMTPGTYHWSVRAIDPIDRKGASLQWRKLEVTPPRKLRAPKLELKQ